MLIAGAAWLAFLSDQLTFSVAIGGKPNLLGNAQGFANSSELRGFVAPSAGRVP
jgi:hypothetical protein